MNAFQEEIRYSFIKFCICCFFRWYEFFVHYALRFEKMYQHDCDARPLEFHFLVPRECLANPFRALSLCVGVISKTPGLISSNKFVKKFLSASTNAITSWQDVTWSFFCSGAEECGTKLAHNFLFHKSSFRIRRTHVMGMFKHFPIILDAIRRSLLNKSTTAAMSTSVRVDFGRLSLSSSSTR